MRFFKWLGLNLFSLVALLLAIIMILIGLDVIRLEAIATLIPMAFASKDACIITYSVCGCVILLALMCLFGRVKRKKQDGENGILLQNADGQLLITKETLENIVDGVVEHTDTIYDAMPTVIIDNANNVSVRVSATVVEGAVIKDVSAKLQNDIKEAVKNATDLEVSSVDVAISNVNVEKADKRSRKSRKEVARVEYDEPATNEYEEAEQVADESYEAENNSYEVTDANYEEAAENQVAESEAEYIAETEMIDESSADDERVLEEAIADAENKKSSKKKGRKSSKRK